MNRPRRTAVLLVGGLALLAGAGGAAPASGDWEPDRRLTVDPGRSLTTYNFARSVAAEPDGRIHAVWYDDRSGSSQIYIRRSVDHGTIWETERVLSTGFDQAEHPAITSSGQTVLVVWHGRRPGTASFDVFLRRSLDGGRTWEPAAALTASHAAAHSAVALDGLTAQVVWVDTRSGLSEVRTRHSSDGGASWGKERQLSAGRRANSWVPTVEVAGDAVHVAWVDTQDGNEEEYYRRSTDAGRTWGPAIRLTRNAANSWAPSLAVTGSQVHLVWFDQRDSPVQAIDEWEIYTRRSDDGGRTWGPLLRLTRAPGRSLRPSVVADGDRVTVLWFDGRDGDLEIYAKESADGGRTWSEDDRLTRAPGESRHVSVATAGGELYAVWYDERDGNPEVYFKRRSTESASSQP